MMHCMAAAHIGFACAADKWMSIDGQLIIYTRVTRAILCVVHSSHTHTTQNLFCRSRVLLCLELGCLELIK